jgi:lysophospholipid acyltransferase (LPLAT)-like uncharacterized protein
MHALLGLLYATCRFTYRGAGERLNSPSAHEPCIYVAWHRDMIMLSHAYRNQNVAVVISQSRDGELAARIVRRMGYWVVRGSSSRGGISALKELIMMLREGHNIGVLADGPRGPAGQTKDGVIYLACKAGAPLVPLAAKATRSITFRSWDRMILPLPFSRVTIMEGEPFIIPSDLNREEFINYASQLTWRIEELHRAMADKR